MRTVSIEHIGVERVCVYVIEDCVFNDIQKNNKDIFAI